MQGIAAVVAAACLCSACVTTTYGYDVEPIGLRVPEQGGEVRAVSESGQRLDVPHTAVDVPLGYKVKRTESSPWCWLAPAASGAVMLGGIGGWVAAPATSVPQDCSLAGTSGCAIEPTGIAESGDVALGVAIGGAIATLATAGFCAYQDSLAGEERVPERWFLELRKQGQAVDRAEKVVPAEDGVPVRLY